MKTLLVLAQHPELAESVRAALNPELVRVIHRLDLAEAEPQLSRAGVDGVIIDADTGSIQGIWLLEKIRRRAPNCPLIVFTGARSFELEEEAYLQGVTHVLTKPVRPRLLNALLERLWAAPVAARLEHRALPLRPVEPSRQAHTAHSAAEALGVLRDFTSILNHSLDAEGLLKKFLLKLREILGVNRAAIFLKPSAAATVFGEAGEISDTRRMRSACAIGLAPGLLEHFELSFETGIGGFLFRQGRILRRENPEAHSDVEMQKEFELLGAQVAIPIHDRESLVGVAVFDGRVTGEPIVNGELELIFHLLEELGLAVKNIWLHDQIAANHGMMVDVLRELSSACVVVGRDLGILHANKAARHMFSRPGRRNADLEFSDLPQALGARIFQVLKTGTGQPLFKYQPGDSLTSVFHVTVVPFQRGGAAMPVSALMVVEDHSQAEQFRKLEIEAASLRLMKSMADRLAHEVGNALVPLSTHQQLLGERYKDPEFRVSLDLTLSESVKRVSRLTSQMRYLARDAVLTREAVPLAQLIEDAFKEAHRHQPAKSAKLLPEDSSQPVILSGDRSALRHAISEVILNAIQANPAEAKVRVRTFTDTDGHGQPWVHLEVTDNGTGFTPEAVQKMATPFFTTRTVGLGLGLCVVRRIIETHQGRLAVVAPTPGQPGTVRISLPQQSSAAAA